MSLKLIKKSEDRKKKHRTDLILYMFVIHMMKTSGQKKNIDKSRMKKPTSNCI